MLKQSEEEVERFMGHILRCLYDYISAPYNKAWLKVASAWENDETHIRHMSVVGQNGQDYMFRIERPDADTWKPHTVAKFAPADGARSSWWDQHYMCELTQWKVES